MDNAISPIPQARISQIETSSTTSKQQIKPNLTNKADSVELSTKPKMSKTKKALIVAGAVVGTAALVAGTVALIQKGKLKNIQQEANSIQTKSEPVKKEAEKLVDEFLEKFKDVKPSEDGTKVIQEMAQNGKDIARRATLDVNEKLTIDDFINKTKIVKKGNYLGVDKGVEFLKDGTYKAKELFNFEDGNLFRFVKKYQFNAARSMSAAKITYFEDGKISQIREKYQVNADWDETTAKITDFKDGKISQIREKYQSNRYGDETIGKDTYFKDGKISEINEKYQLNTDGSRSIAKITYFKDGKIVKTERDIH